VVDAGAAADGLDRVGDEGAEVELLALEPVRPLSSRRAASSICSTIVFTWLSRSSMIERARLKPGVCGFRSPSRIIET
jgi:hypothetical protein